MNQVRLSRRAMATTWEILLYGNSDRFLQGVAEEALDEVERIEQLLSPYRTTSCIADVNRNAHNHSVFVGHEVFSLIRTSVNLSQLTGGAFDITVAPLMRCWGMMSGRGSVPSLDDIKGAMNFVGVEHMMLQDEDYSIQFDREGVMLDLGAIGKGYAIDRVMDIVRDHGVVSALLHGGGSTIYGLGVPPDGDDRGWAITSRLPEGSDSLKIEPFFLHDLAISVSAPHGKSFEVDGKQYGHIIDPRDGQPVNRCLSASVVSASATETDALTTALVTLGPSWLPEFRSLWPDATASVIFDTDTGERRILRSDSMEEDNNA